MCYFVRLKPFLGIKINHLCAVQFGIAVILYSIALKHSNFLAEIALSHTIVKHTYLFLQRAIGRYQVHNLAKKVGAARSVKILKKCHQNP